jgi:hypothetical protein
MASRAPLRNQRLDRSQIPSGFDLSAQRFGRRFGVLGAAPCRALRHPLSRAVG